MSVVHSKSFGRRPRLLPQALSRLLRRLAVRAVGAALVLAVAALALALISYDATDPSPLSASSRPVANWLGLPGAYAADFLVETLGIGTAALLLPPLVWGLRLILLRGIPAFWTHLLIVPAATLFAALLAATVAGPSGGLGGGLGALGLSLIADGWAALGAAPPRWIERLVLALLLASALPATLGIPWHEWRGAAVRLWTTLRGAEMPRPPALPSLPSLPSLRLGRRAEASDVQPAPDTPATDAAAAETVPVARPRKTNRSPSDEADPPTKPRGRKTVEAPAKPGRRVDPAPQGQVFGTEHGGFRLPGLGILSKADAAAGNTALGADALEENARLLETVLADFGIKGEILNVRPGPVVTLYELRPAPGTKSARVIGLADDIARSMSAISARVAVIPGANAIGIELPNADRQTVVLRELLESRAFERSNAALPVVIGKDIGGSPIIADLATMPHLLVAGTTGSGKSVGVNAMILSLLYRLPPEQCKFILVDPKMLELSVYDDIPNLLTPVVTDPKKAVVALKWAVREMEERYRAMSKLGVRNINGFNKRVREAQAAGQPLTRQVQTGFDKETHQPVYEEQEFDVTPYPHIVIVIDEMADLMLVAGKEVEATVQRLAQMARAAGLHVIMATQRPSVDVITGTIKANFPTRLSYQVTSKIDSRTILGEQGAEQLLGKGDSLFMAGGGRITRVHGAFVSDQEVEAVADYLRKQAPPSYIEEVTEEPEEGFDSPFIPGPGGGTGNGGGGGDSDNELYDRAVAIVLRDRRVSTSYIQRQLRIGYNRAATLIDEMEREGVITAPNHAGKREVIPPGEGQ
ncbi:DNA translocase FtsK [Rhodothalassium salexigens DSM 2132]|uniref:DNA translocase FtsK n=1 Tax=Rhodothalassium salexigens DSM 2132 TaxID=1188247 RepID=A0A4R2P978_RHOSA|nr:DNA translocase FtsK 4TM domain-containing protein [Rhodothalassium salexigens]MBB4212513.1 S-DNA-T family DNA segregation ATPase FtsK/SpoIIIE [Rhodothalassium salexigens DSM 2132]TCP31447.1 DNA translocase FtsK [Rhodothalassium salexigens DSM 2132]